MRNFQLKTWAAGMMMAGLLSCGESKYETGSFQVIPLPQEITETTGAQPFIVRPSTTICYPEGNEKMERTARFLAGYIREVTGTQVKVGTRAGSNCIQLSLDATLSHPESYELTVTKDGVQLKGATEAAVFLGTQTLYKALPITEGNALGALPAGTVKDEPRFAYRGFMIDVGRHFFSVDYLKELIDVMALHNINHFHWHLTEDQGWRIEIKKYPKLTEIGATRKETITAPGANEYDGTPVSGFYTQEEAR